MTLSQEQRIDALLNYCGQLFEYTQDGFEVVGKTKLEAATHLVSAAVIAKVDVKDYEEIVKRGAAFRARVTTGDVRAFRP